MWPQLALWPLCFRLLAGCPSCSSSRALLSSSPAGTAPSLLQEARALAPVCAVTVGYVLLYLPP